MWRLGGDPVRLPAWPRSRRSSPSRGRIALAPTARGAAGDDAPAAAGCCRRASAASSMGRASSRLGPPAPLGALMSWECGRARAVVPTRSSRDGAALRRLRLACWTGEGHLFSAGASSSRPSLNVLGVSTSDAYLLLRYFIGRARAATLKVERARSERLLLNVLPGADRRAPEGGRGRHRRSFDEVRVLFADIVGFTRFGAASAGRGRRDARRGLRALRRAGRRARPREDQDDRRRLHGRRRDPAARATTTPRRSPRWRSTMRAASPRLRELSTALSSTIRIGIDCGPAVAGVIGRAEVQLRPVGRHGQHRQPHGVARRARRDPGHRA